MNNNTFTLNELEDVVYEMCLEVHNNIDAFKTSEEAALDPHKWTQYLMDTYKEKLIANRYK